VAHPGHKQGDADEGRSPDHGSSLHARPSQFPSGTQWAAAHRLQLRGQSRLWSLMGTPHRVPSFVLIYLRNHRQVFVFPVASSKSRHSLAVAGRMLGPSFGRTPATFRANFEFYSPDRRQGCIDRSETHNPLKSPRDILKTAGADDPKNGLRTQLRQYPRGVNPKGQNARERP